MISQGRFIAPQDVEKSEISQSLSLSLMSCLVVPVSVGNRVKGRHTGNREPSLLLDLHGRVDLHNLRYGSYMHIQCIFYGEWLSRRGK